MVAAPMGAETYPANEHLRPPAVAYRNFFVSTLPQRRSMWQGLAPGAAWMRRSAGFSPRPHADHLTQRSRLPYHVARHALGLPVPWRSARRTAGRQFQLTFILFRHLSKLLANRSQFSC